MELDVMSKDIILHMLKFHASKIYLHLVAEAVKNSLKAEHNSGRPVYNAHVLVGRMPHITHTEKEDDTRQEQVVSLLNIIHNA